MPKYDNSGTLGKNDRKEKANHPDLKGKATIAGVDYWISGWKKAGDNGPWVSLSFTPREQPDDKPRRVAHDDGTPDDDLPFR